MKITDFFVQTVVLASTLVILLLGLIDHHVLGYALLTQFVIGFWQYVGGIAWLIAYRQVRSRQIHMIAATLYLIILFVGMQYPVQTIPGKDLLLGIFLFIPPWVLALYYYAITWKSVFPKTGKQSKFLPHISF
ncbi:MAG TPA: hypothetical protein VGK59_02005 [Ohtaekwangia sp.]